MVSTAKEPRNGEPTSNQQYACYNGSLGGEHAAAVFLEAKICHCVILSPILDTQFLDYYIRSRVIPPTLE
jgi:hypothetical protein